MAPISQVGQLRLDGQNWVNMVHDLKLADRSDDSDTIRARLEQIQNEEEESKAKGEELKRVVERAAISSQAHF